jgi:hypothetical protein
VQRAWILPLLLAPACSFRSPGGSGDGDGGLPDPDAVESRCNLADSWEKGKQPTKTIRVSKRTPAGTPDGSQESPFPSLSAASSMIGPGVQVLLEPGNYDGATFTGKQGSADAPIWLEGPESGTPARILGNGGPGLHLIRPQYWVIRNLELATLPGEIGINIDDGSQPGSAKSVVIDHIKVGSTDRACLQLSGVTDVVIRDSTLGSCNRGVMMVGVQNATIARNTIGAMTVAGVALAGGSSNIDVRQNQIENVNNGIGVWIGGQSDVSQFRPALMNTGNAEARNIRVFNNVIRDVRDAIQCSNCTSSLVAHNLIRRASRNLLLLHQPYTELSSGGNTYEFVSAGGVRVVNNAIELRSSAGAFSTSGNELDAESCTFSHNMWLREGGPWEPPLPSDETDGILDTQSGYAETGRLCKTTSSRAAGAGTPLPEVDGTLQGACRDTPRSIGPSEPDPDC